MLKVSSEFEFGTFFSEMSMTLYITTGCHPEPFDCHPARSEGSQGKRFNVVVRQAHHPERSRRTPRRIYGDSSPPNHMVDPPRFLAEALPQNDNKQCEKV